jgi:hypothetical protein
MLQLGATGIEGEEEEEEEEEEYQQRKMALICFLVYLHAHLSK